MNLTTHSHNFRNLNSMSLTPIPFHLHEIDGQIRVPLVADMLFDKTFLISPTLMSENEVFSYMDELKRFSYADLGLFFFPQPLIENNPILAEIREHITKFKQNIDPQICTDTTTLIGEKYTEQGLFLLVQDDLCLLLDDIVENYKDLILANFSTSAIDAQQVVYFENREEFSGRMFFQYFKENFPLSFEALVQTGAFDDGCFLPA